MANVTRNERKFIVTAPETSIIGNAADGAVSTWAVHIVKAAAATMSCTVVSRIQGKTANDDSVAFVAVPYAKRYLNAAVADDTLVTTAITNTSLILIPATGQSIGLDFTSASGGDITVYVEPVYGAAA